MQRFLRYAKLLTNGCLAMFDARVVSGGISKPRHRLQSPDILHQRVFPAATYTGGEHSDTSEDTVLQLAQGDVSRQRFAAEGHFSAGHWSTGPRIVNELRSMERFRFVHNLNGHALLVNCAR